ncbi:hypothetical protein Tco_1345785 [Tanacetum coccineum]
MAINNMYQPWRTFMTMINKCLTGKVSRFDRPRLALLQVLWGMTVDSQETEDEEEEPQLTRRRQIGVIIGREAHRESVEEDLDHLMKLKGIEMLSTAAQFKSSEGSGIAPEFLDGPSGSSSSSSFDFEYLEGFLPTDDEARPDMSDDERSEADDTKKADAEKDELDKAEEEKAEEEHHVDDEGENKQARDIYAEVHISEPPIEKPTATLISSSITLSSAEYTNQFLNETVDVSLINVLKEPVEAEVQSMVEQPVL